MKKQGIFVVFAFSLLLGAGISSGNLIDKNIQNDMDFLDAGGLICHWSFNQENTVDLSGNEYHGEGIGIHFSDGVFSFGCEINDGSDRVSYIPDAFDDSIHNEMTFSSWIYLYENPIDQNRYVFDCREDAWDGGGFIFLITKDNYASFQFREVGEDKVVVSSSKIPIETWTYVAVVFNHNVGSISMFINGVENNVSTTYKGYSQSMYDAVIGNNHWGYIDGEWRPLNGIIDEIRIYNRALDSSEINNLFENPSGMYNAFLFGKIEDIEQINEDIMFKAVNLYYFKGKPFSIHRYFLGETIRITNDYKGFLSGNFIFASVQMEVY